MSGDISPTTGAGKKRKAWGDNYKRPRWYGAHIDHSPVGDSLLHRIAATGVTEIRWCDDQSTGKGYQMFLFKRAGMYTPTWERHVRGWNLTPSFNEGVEKACTAKLWFAYGLLHMGNTNVQLTDNRIILSTTNVDGSAIAEQPHKDPKFVIPLTVTVPSGPAASAAASTTPLDATPASYAAASTGREQRASPVPSVAVASTSALKRVWKQRVTDFFLSGAPFVDPQNTMGDLIQLMFPCLTPADSTKLDRFLGHHHLNGLAGRQLSQSHETVPVAVLTLEIHRRVIRLEKLAADLGNYIAEQFVNSESGQGADIDYIKRFGGGVHGAGAAFWSPSSSDICETDLSSSVAWMRAHREVAFTRSYIVADDVTWGFPVLCKLIILWKQASPVTPAFALLLDGLSAMIGIRTNIMAQERLYLLRYGSHLTAYCRRLQALISTHALSPPQNLLEANGSLSQGEFGESALPIDDGLQGRALPANADIIHSTIRRVEQEQLEAETVVRVLKIQLPAPATRSIQQFMKGVQLLMQNDSHLLNATICLPPTTSLPAAALNAGKICSPP